MEKRKFFKTISKQQDRTAQTIFEGFRGLVSMGTDFDQFSGLVFYHYYLKTTGDEVLTITVDRLGKLIRRSYNAN